MNNINTIKQLSLKKKRVFLRTDFNVPRTENNIENDYKLKACLPTLELLLNQQASIVLGTHMGRPQALSQTNFFDPALSTNIIAQWLTKNNIPTELEPDLLTAIEKSKKQPKKIILLENLRFYNGEQQYDIKFAELLAQCGDYFINDAFGLMHRSDTSITLLAQKFEHTNRSIGLLVEKELSNLSGLTNNPQLPFLIIVGGKKIATKIVLLKSMISKGNSANSIILGGALVLPFFGYGSEHEIALSQEIRTMAQQKNISLILPHDIVIQEDTKIKTKLATELDSNDSVIDIGPQSILEFTEHIKHTQTIFTNGTMGIYEQPNAQAGTKAILQAIGKSQAFSIIGGGDAVSAAQLFKLDNNIDFLSTGGGATLAYLAATNPQQQLPGLKALTPE